MCEFPLNACRKFADAEIGRGAVLILIQPDHKSAGNILYLEARTVIEGYISVDVILIEEISPEPGIDIMLQPAGKMRGITGPDLEAILCFPDVNGCAMTEKLAVCYAVYHSDHAYHYTEGDS